MVLTEIQTTDLVFTEPVLIYCELCMISHFQEVDAGRGHRENYVQRSQVISYYVNSRKFIVAIPVRIPGGK